MRGMETDHVISGPMSGLKKTWGGDNTQKHGLTTPRLTHPRGPSPESRVSERRRRRRTKKEKK